MKVEGYQYPHSSFLSVEKDMGIITNMMLKNNRLKKLLYHTTKDCLNRPKLTEDQTVELIGKNIKMVPKFKVDKEVLNYIVITFDNFSRTFNTEFRDNIIEFDIICHFDQWQLQDFQLRPYMIAAEIDTMFNEKHLTGIGTLNFVQANQIIINDEFAGLCLMYRTVHGEDDKKHSPTVKSEESRIDNFNELFNT